MKPGRKPNPAKPSASDAAPPKMSRIPTPPRFLTKPAKAHFRKVAKQLMALEILTEADCDALAIYCQAFASWGDAISINDMTLAKQLQGQLRQMQNEFGMTPASRGRVKIPMKEKDNEWDLL